MKKFISMFAVAFLTATVILTLSSCAGSKGSEVAEAEPIECIAYNPETHFCDTRDGKTYKYAIIGEQVWMAENLNYDLKGKIFSIEIPLSTCNNCDKYGRLYNWGEAKFQTSNSPTSRACPSGWYLPSDAQWKQLVDFAGGGRIAGKHLKAKTGWSDNGNGLDTYGFAAIQGGSMWWSSSAPEPNALRVSTNPNINVNIASAYTILYNDDGVLTSKIHKDNNRLNVRCIAYGSKAQYELQAQQLRVRKQQQVEQQQEQQAQIPEPEQPPQEQSQEQQQESQPEQQQEPQ